MCECTISGVCVTVSRDKTQLHGDTTEEVDLFGSRRVLNPAGLSTRLAFVLKGHTLEQIVERLGEAGYRTSVETVRRYREGLAQRIDALFLAAVVGTFEVDGNWLLVGREVHESNPQSPGVSALLRVAGAVHQEIAELDDRALNELVDSMLNSADLGTLVHVSRDVHRRLGERNVYLDHGPPPGMPPVDDEAEALLRQGAKPGIANEPAPDAED